MKKLVIVGGGSTYTLPMLKTIIDDKEVFGIDHISLVDINVKRQELIYQAGQVLMQDTKISLSAHHNDEQGIYENALFVFMQIRSGGLNARIYDEQIPLKYGLVGQETCGAGGFTYGLRSVPDVIKIINDVRAQNKDCYIINYSNPAAIVAEATRRQFPNDNKIINLCDMPIAMLDGFAKALNTSRCKLHARYFGLNHFGWFTKIYDQDGTDVLPKLKKMLADSSLVPEELKDDKDWQHTFEMLSQMVNDFKGYIPNTYLQYYLYPQKCVNDSDPEYPRAMSVIDGREEKVKKQCKHIIEKQTIIGSGLESGVHGKYIVELANSLLNNVESEFILIVENNGIINNLADDVMVEVPCLISKRGIEPLHVGKIPTFYKALIENQNGFEKLAVDSLFNNDLDASLKALVLNRTINDASIAKQLLTAILEENNYFGGQHE